ncbi:MAG: DUF4595 domain-containing protein [Bacteroides sp.]|nr:DUF4595 domain-containing protein [Bacteroides sp.]
MKKKFTTIGCLSAVLLITLSVQDIVGAERKLKSTSLSEPGEPTETASYDYYEEGREFEGRLRTVEDNSDRETSIVTFHYDNLATQKKVEVTAEGPMRQQYSVTLYIGDNGYAERAEYEYPYTGKSEAITFEYDEAGHLTGTRIVENDETLEYTLTYTSGNLTQVRCIETENGIIEEDYTANLTYTGVPNTGELMFYDTIFGIDLEVLEYTYFAGLLGIASPELPTGVTVRDEDSVETESFVWTLDTDNYPTKLVVGDETMLFTWTDVSGIEEITGETDETPVIYGADGISRTTVGQGLNIIRNADGSTVKILRNR